MYYHSQPTQSPPVKKYPIELIPPVKHNATESGKSKTTNNIHLFFAEQDENMDEMMDRKLSTTPSLPNLPLKTRKNGETKTDEKARQNKETPKKKNKNKKAKENSSSEKKPAKEIIVKRASTKSSSNEQNKPRKASPTPLDDPMYSPAYAGGGYQKSPDPKQFSKPNLVSPAKKEKKSSETKELSKPLSLQDKFASVHSASAPHLFNIQSHVANGFQPIFYSGYPPNFYGYPIQENASPTKMMTLDEANQDLKSLLNIK